MALPFGDSGWRYRLASARVLPLGGCALLDVDPHCSRLSKHVSDHRGELIDYLIGNLNPPGRKNFPDGGSAQWR